MDRLLSLVSGPAQLAVAQSLAKAHLRLEADFAEDDTIIDFYTEAAQNVAQERLSKQLITQTWDESLASASGKVYLSKAPVQSLVSVKYYDSDNVQQTATLSDFTLVASDDWAYVDCDSWPQAYDRADAITIQYVAGYGDAVSDVPAEIRQAILLLLGQYDGVRENATEATFTEIPAGFDALINLHARGWYG